MVNEDIDKFQDNWIVLDVANTSSSIVEVQFFDPDKNYNETTFQASNLQPTILAATTYTLAYQIKPTPSPTLAIFLIGSYPTIELLVAALNAEGAFQENGVGIFSYTVNADTTWNLIANSALLELDTFSSAVPLNNQQFISFGTFTSESTLSLNEITQELVYQPYRLDTVDVFAANVAQANQQFMIKDRSPNGTFYEDVQNPEVSPTQPQPALINISIDYIPSPTNILLYKMNALESVRFIFKYTHISLNSLDGNQLITPDKVIELPVSTSVKDNSMRGIVLQSMKQDQLKRLNVYHLNQNNIKRLVAGYL